VLSQCQYEKRGTNKNQYPQFESLQSNIRVWFYIQVCVLTQLPAVNSLYHNGENLFFPGSAILPLKRLMLLKLKVYHKLVYTLVAPFLRDPRIHHSDPYIKEQAVFTHSLYPNLLAGPTKIGKTQIHISSPPPYTSQRLASQQCSW